MSKGWKGKGQTKLTRTKINIHGGAVWESAGCIDLTCGDADFFKDVLRDSGGKDVRLTVDYFGNSMPKDSKEPAGCAKPWEAQKQ